MVACSDGIDCVSYNLLFEQDYEMRYSYKKFGEERDVRNN